ncbi:MAG: CPBP family intramembrane metalloprotease [Treponema sp.]|nr:CPBP family intramembrane metalloprotease [Treponema sp.]
MEALILYFVIFFPGIYAPPSPDWLVNGAGAAGTIPFSIAQQAGRMLTYTLPSLALLLYLISRGEDRPALKAAAPHRRDMLPFAAGLPCLIIIGLFVSFLGSHFAGAAPPLRVEGPSGVPGWFVVVLVCLSAGYLEEIYFRYYLLSRMEQAIPRTAVRVLFSTVLFAVIHASQGSWGILNAAIAGLFLAALFLRFRSLHGVAWAHAGYNVFVYAMGAAGVGAGGA